LTSEIENALTKAIQIM